MLLMVRLDTTATFYTITSVQDPNTGNRYMQVTDTRREMVATEDVGTETFYSAYMTNINLTKTIQMLRMNYKGQLYLKLDNDPTVYQVTRVAKGINRQYIKLPLTDCKDTTVVDVINNV